MDNNNKHNYKEFVLEILENSGTLENGKLWSNYTIITCVHKDGIPWKIESYKGSPKHIGNLFNVGSVRDLRRKLIGHKVISYAFDRYGKICSFIVSDGDEVTPS